MTVPTFDIANAPLDAPAAGISTTLSVTFTWQSWGVANESNAVGLTGPDQKETLFAPVGEQTSFILRNLPNTLRYRVDYGWFVQITSNAGTSRSFVGGNMPGNRLIRFEPSEETSPLPTPTSSAPIQ